MRMSESTRQVKQVRARRRRSPNVPGGRRISHEVKVSEAEELRLQLLAQEREVTVPRLLLESALAGDRQTVTDVRDAVGQLFALQRYLGALSNNINQIARVANATGELPNELRATVAAVREQMERVESATRSLTADGVVPTPRPERVRLAQRHRRERPR